MPTLNHVLMLLDCFKLVTRQLVREYSEMGNVRIDFRYDKLVTHCALQHGFGFLYAAQGAKTTIGVNRSIGGVGTIIRNCCHPQKNSEIKNCIMSSWLVLQMCPPQVPPRRKVHHYAELARSVCGDVAFRTRVRRHPRPIPGQAVGVAPDDDAPPPWFHAYMDKVRHGPLCGLRNRFSPKKISNQKTRILSTQNTIGATSDFWCSVNFWTEDFFPSASQENLMS